MGATCSSTSDMLELRSSLSGSSQQWPGPTMTRIHAALRAPFDPDTLAEHRALLESLWHCLLAPAEFARTSPAWKRVGFQGEDPATDVRGGGLLAMQCISHFATLHTFGFRAMLLDLADLEALGGTSGGFYPLSTTAIVVCVKLCDAIGLSAGMRGPISADELQILLASPPQTQLAADLRPLLADGRRRGGFFGLFSLLLADFHVRFTLTRASYLECQSLVDKAVEVLSRRLEAVRRRRRSTALDAASLVRSASYRGSRAFAALFALYTTADVASDAGDSHSRDVHALLTATEVWRNTSLKKLRAAVRLVALEKTAERAAAHTQRAQRTAATAVSDAAPPTQASPSHSLAAAAAAADEADEAAARVSAAHGCVGGRGGGTTSTVAAAVDDDTPHVRVTLDVVADATCTAIAGPTRAILEVLPMERPRAGTFSALVGAAVAAREAAISAQLQPPIELALPTSSSIKEQKMTTDVRL